MNNNQVRITPPVVILAGGCDEHVIEKMESYREVLIDSFSDFRGTILSGGTAAGISKIAAEIGVIYSATITTIGYLPACATPDSRYSHLVNTQGHDFSLVESLRMWGDILLSECDPRKVVLIGVNGGVIARGEYQIAVAMGARVGLIIGSGRSADDMLRDPFWSRMVISLGANFDEIRRLYEFHENL